VYAILFKLDCHLGEKRSSLENFLTGGEGQNNDGDGQQGCKTVSKPEKYSKLPLNMQNGQRIYLPDGHKTYQIAIKHTKWP
jgi:hypothetical protein